MVWALVVASLLFFAGQEDAQKAGLQALDHGDYQGAVQIFAKLIADDPKDYASFFNLALAESFLHQDNRAIRHLQQTLELKPKLYEAELNLGMLLLRDKRPAEALPLLQDASSQKPKEVRPERYQADALLATGDLPSAERTYQLVLQLDPKLAAAQLGLGQTFARQGKLDEALSHYRSAAALDSKLASSLVELAQAFEQANRASDAVALLHEAPAEVAVQEELGRLYLSTNQPALAVEAFRSAVAHSPTAANRVALASAYLKNNQEALAAPLLEKALAEAPSDFELRIVVGRIRRDRHEYRNAATLFVTAAAIKPDSVEAWNEAAISFVLSDQYPQALTALDRLHALSAETAGNFYYRAIALDKLHQIKPAIASYQRFLQLSDGKYPDQEFSARQRSKTLEHEVNR